MNIILVGYGRMGKEIEKIALSRGHNIIKRIDFIARVGDATEFTAKDLKEADAVIEFALPKTILENCQKYCESEVPTVIGTTGWENKREEISKMFESKGTLLWGNNYSLGAHMLFKLTEKASAMVSAVSNYDMSVLEYHHKLKKDSPSGTALTIAEKIIENNQYKTTIACGNLDREISPTELHVSSVRAGFYPGTHIVSIDGADDTIELKHTARNRSIFALGAVMAAEWVANKKGFYRVENFIDEIL